MVNGANTKKGIPFCLVRSKVDNEVNSNKGRKVGERDNLLQIRQELIRKTRKYSCMMLIWPFSEIWID
jgi:hypothetical protein